MADAIFSAGFLNACLRNADIMAMANVAPSVNARGPLFVHDKGIVRRTTFHAMQLYGDHLRDRIIASRMRSTDLETDGQCVPAVDAIVSGDEQGTTVIAINRSPDTEARCNLRLDGTSLDGTFEAEVLTGDSPDAYNDIDAPDNVSPRKEKVAVKNEVFSVPPHSLMVLSLKDVVLC